MKPAFGKLPPNVLAALLSRIPQDPRLIIGPRVGEDAAVIDFGDRCLVAKSDPITFATERIGWYAVQVNANDLATLGVVPRWFLATLLLPAGAGSADAAPALAESIFDDLLRACDELGVALCGGHTEVTPGLDRPIVCGHMLGEVARERLVRKDRMGPGDVLLLTRGAAIEGTAILARERADLAGRLPPEVLERARNLLFQPGISVVRDALAAAAAARLHGMHDPTEGGLVGGLCELAAAAAAGVEVDAGRIPVLPETRAVCDALGLDPLRLIASGALLIAAAPEDAEAVTAALAAQGTPVAIIGRVTAGVPELRLEGKRVEFPERDEITRAL